MNWKRGFLRLFVLFTAIWVPLVFFLEGFDLWLALSPPAFMLAVWWVARGFVTGLFR